MVASKSLFVLIAVTTALLCRPLASPAADDVLGTVEGTITLDGKPLAGARITFHLPGGQFVGAKVKDDGTYKVDRVPAGAHKVTIELLANGKAVLPPKYSSEEESALRVEVKKNQNTLNFDLATK